MNWLLLDFLHNFKIYLKEGDKCCRLLLHTSHFAFSNSMRKSIIFLKSSLQLDLLFFNDQLRRQKIDQMVSNEKRKAKIYSQAKTLMMGLRQMIFLFFCFFLTSCTHAKTDDLTQVSEIQVPQQPVKKNLVRSLIVLDPGHGGYDLGAHAPSCEEKKIALQTSLLVKKYLNDMGYRVILTRQDDIFIPLKKRAEVANQSNARLFLSIHFNAAKSNTANGIEVFFYDKSPDWRVRSSKRLGRCVLSRLLDRTGAASRGVKGGNFLVIRETSMPAILIEGGFITHMEERGKLKDSQYIEKVAKAIAEGVDSYFKTS